MDRFESIGEVGLAGHSWLPMLPRVHRLLLRLLEGLQQKADKRKADELRVKLLLINYFFRYKQLQLKFAMHVQLISYVDDDNNYY